jgi:hypothetical protein
MERKCRHVCFANKNNKKQTGKFNSAPHNRLTGSVESGRREAGQEVQSVTAAVCGVLEGGEAVEG